MESLGALSWERLAAFLSLLHADRAREQATPGALYAAAAAAASASASGPSPYGALAPPPPPSPAASYSAWSQLPAPSPYGYPTPQTPAPQPPLYGVAPYYSGPPPFSAVRSGSFAPALPPAYTGTPYYGVPATPRPGELAGTLATPGSAFGSAYRGPGSAWSSGEGSAFGPPSDTAGGAPWGYGWGALGGAAGAGGVGPVGGTGARAGEEGGERGAGREGDDVLFCAVLGLIEAVRVGWVPACPRWGVCV